MASLNYATHGGEQLLSGNMCMIFMHLIVDECLPLV